MISFLWAKNQEIEMGYVFSRAVCITVGFLHPAYHHFKHIKRGQVDSVSKEYEYLETSDNFNQHWITMAIFCVAEVLSDIVLYW